MNRSGAGAGAAGPLAGLRVLVTRAEGQAEGMMEALRAAGAEPIALPLIRIAEAADGGAALRAAAAGAASFDWIVFTSANGVERFVEAVAGSPVALAGVRLACIGPGTAAALRGHGLVPAVVAERHVAEGLLAALPLAEMRGRRVLLPLARGARPVLADGLREAGAEVVVVEAYRTVPDGRSGKEVRERLERGEIDVLTFASPSAVERFVDEMGTGTGGALVAVIGPVTAGAAEALGLGAQVVAREHTIAGLIGVLIEHHRKPGRTKQP